MARALVVGSIVTVLGGCGANLGGPCALDNPCEDGVCDLTDPSGGTCIAADGDLDGDGIRNDKDFCNHVAGGAFDEDRDGLGNECDPCPIAAPPETPDGDDDGVDSPCDPDPRTSGERITVFDGFDDGMPAGWKATAGWTFVGGEAIVTPIDPIAIEQLTAPLPLVTQSIAVLGQYRIDASDPQATQNFAGVVAIDERPAGGSRVSCAGTRTGTTDNLVLDTPTASTAKPFTNLFDSASLYRVAMQLDAADAACAMIADAETGAVQATTNGEIMNGGGLVAKGATARFQYLLVVQRQP
ncbi:MAG TPA: hypothetical protein VFQ53_27870 [Kofleriaceae bacterium]|nr:hypothetical protein [Kofleriaceae bacterium]